MEGNGFEATNLATLGTALGAMVCISVPLVVHTCTPTAMLLE